MVGVDYQLDWILSHLWDKPYLGVIIYMRISLDIPLRDFLVSVNWGGSTRPFQEGRSLGRGPGLYADEKASWVGNRCFVLDGGCNIPSCFNPLLPWLPLDDGAHPWTMSQSKHFRPQVAFVRFFFKTTANRKETKTRKEELDSRKKTSNLIVPCLAALGTGQNDVRSNIIKQPVPRDLFDWSLYGISRSLALCLHFWHI